MYGYTFLNKWHLSKVFKESRHWDKDAHSHQQTWTQSELPNFRGHTAQICQLFFSSGKEREQTRTVYCPGCPKTATSPALQQHPVADLSPTLTRPGYFSRTVSIKQSGNHGLLGTAWGNPVACPHIELRHHFGGLLLKTTRFLCAAGASTPAHTTRTAPRKRCRSAALLPAHLTARRLCLSTETHSWLYVKQHTPQVL